MEGLEGTDGCKEKEERSTSPWRDNNDTHGTEYQMGSRCNDALFFLLNGRVRPQSVQEKLTNFSHQTFSRFKA